MASATGRKGQQGGLGLRLELAHGPTGPLARLHAGPAVLAPGLRLAALVAEPLPEVVDDAAGGDAAAAGAQVVPRSGRAAGSEAGTTGARAVEDRGAKAVPSPAALREGPWRAVEARLEATAEGLTRAAAGLCGARIGGWPIEQVSVDLAGERAVLTLTGPRDEGWPALAQIELTAQIEGEAVRVAASRVWATGPLAPTGAGLWAAVTRALAAAWPGAITGAAGEIRVDPAWLVRRAFTACAARPPQTGGLRPARLRAQGRSLRLTLAREVSSRTGSKKHVVRDMSQGPDDPLAGLRAALRAGDRAGALAELEQAPAPTHPGARRLTGALAQVRADLLRFVDAEGAAGAVRAWLAADPEDPEAWWRVAIQRGRAGDAEGLARALAALGRSGGPRAGLLRRAARALVVIERLGGRWDERFGDMSHVTCPQEQEAIRRALALVRAADPAVGAAEVEAALQAALAGRGAGEDEELRARVGAVALRAGRDGAATELLLRRIAAEPAGPGVEVAAAVDVAAEVDSLVAVAHALARRGGLARLDAIVEATAERVGTAALEASLRARLCAWPPRPGVVLACASLFLRTGEPGAGAALMQVAGFMLPRAGIASGPAALAERAGRAGGAEPRAAIREVLRGMASETGGIRAPGERPGPPETPEAGHALALAEAALEPLRAALGLRLPLRAGRGEGPVGGVAIRNEREPAIVVYPTLCALPPAERRFRLALAGVLVRAGLAVVLDPAGASLHELLAALAHLADGSTPALPGARTIAGVWARRGIAGERLEPSLRAALAGELRVWRQDEAHVARLAALLREDHVEAAARLSGAVDGALLASGRDARLLQTHDEAAAAAVLASAEAQQLMRGLGLIERGKMP